MHDAMARLENHFRFSKSELFRLLITSAAGAFILSFRKWGGDTFDVSAGITNLLVILVMLFICLIIHYSAQKIVALQFGYNSEYKIWNNGFLISIIVCFFTFGYIPLFFPGVLFFQTVPKLRVGAFRGEIMNKDLGYISAAGPLINLFLVGLIAPAYIATKSDFLFTLIAINLLIAVFSMLPIPTFEKFRQFKGGTTGLYLFIASRWIYVLLFITVIVFSALVLIASVFSYIIAIIIGAIAAFVYYTKYDAEK
jgi:hypothetical protein